MTWENMNMFSDVLPTDDEDDEDGIEAHESSIQCLKEANDATQGITREYSDRRQASFTCRKAEFFNLPSVLQFSTVDNTVNTVGFLAFEMVRSLTIVGLEDSYLRDARASHEAAPP